MLQKVDEREASLQSEAVKRMKLNYAEKRKEWFK